MPCQTPFMCPACGARSFNPNDILHGWCDRCKMGNNERATIAGVLDAVGIRCADPEKLDATSVKTLLKLIHEPLYLDFRAYAERRQWCCLRIAIYNVAILRGSTHDDAGFSDAWEYPSLGPAILALADWDNHPGTEPIGWIRHPRTGRRLATEEGTHYDQDKRLVRKGAIYVRW